ncbi:hypothetical protein [Paraburkholderia aromaticivorans]|uniref:hypothetical protein n=1 Tax=Paraburkholderia aromaticivorans TaxID=2026199 RepID=UPI0038BD05A6
MNELMRATYMAWFLKCAGYGDGPIELFKTAECIAEITLVQAHDSGQHEAWTLDEDSLSIFKRLLALHDVQLASAPRHHFEDAERRLFAFLRGTARSPIPEQTD